MNLVAQITDVFTAMGDWIVSAIQSALPIFYDTTANSGEGALTILGVLCVISVSIGVFLLIVGIIQRFMGFGA